MRWAVPSSPISPDAPQVIINPDGAHIPVLCIDDETGDWFVGGVNKSDTWTPSGGSGLQLITPAPTQDPRVYTLPDVPAILLLFVGGELQKAGAGNDFTIAGATITLVNMPGPGANIQAVVG